MVKLDESYAKQFRSIATRAELIASQDTIIYMRKLADTIHDDFHAAEISLERATHPSYKTHHAEDSPWTWLRDWNAQRDAMHNSFRADLGLDPVKFTHKYYRSAVPEDLTGPMPND